MLVLIVFSGTVGCLPRLDAEAIKQEKIRINEKELIVEIADTDESRERGLSGRVELAQNHGMLFVYPAPRIVSFWMKDTVIPLDIAFISRDGVIAQIESMQPDDGKTHYVSRCAIVAVLETNRGWFHSHGIKVGDRVERIR